MGDLVIYLFEPESPDSFLAWGFFPEIFSHTEYIEEYAIEPLARWMLAKDENLRKEFESKKKEDPAFVNDKAKVYAWFYERSPFYDNRYLVYPVGVERYVLNSDRNDDADDGVAVISSKSTIPFLFLHS